MDDDGFGQATFADALLKERQHLLLGTDYLNYALVYGCDSYGIAHV